MAKGRRANLILCFPHLGFGIETGERSFLYLFFLKIWKILHAHLCFEGTKFVCLLCLWNIYTKVSNDAAPNRSDTRTSSGASLWLSSDTISLRPGFSLKSLCTQQADDCYLVTWTTEKFMTDSFKSQNKMLDLTCCTFISTSQISRDASEGNNTKLFRLIILLKGK